MPAKVDLHGHIGYQHDVASGRSADFIVLDANPLENIAYTRKINRVYLRGQEVDRAGLRAKWQAR
jgi:cytosine/adenosine deaminase-related metal-dependent hydrolase